VLILSGLHGVHSQLYLSWHTQVLILWGLHGRVHEYTFFPHTEVEANTVWFIPNVHVHKYLSFTRRCWYCVKYTVWHVYTFFPHTEVERFTLLHGVTRLRILPPHGGRNVYVVYTEIVHAYTHSSPTRRSIKVLRGSSKTRVGTFLFSQVEKRKVKRDCQSVTHW
jgi:hypothetical protein